MQTWMGITRARIRSMKARARGRELEMRQRLWTAHGSHSRATQTQNMTARRNLNTDQHPDWGLLPP